MSKTDKTDPYWVKEMYERVEYHDHRNGVCDIDEYIFGGRHTWGQRRWNGCCFYQLVRYDNKTFGRPSADSEWMRIENRRKRRADRVKMSKIRKNLILEESMQYSDYRRDVYGLPSW